jgi:hypothetical protein
VSGRSERDALAGAGQVLFEPVRCGDPRAVVGNRPVDLDRLHLDPLLAGASRLLGLLVFFDPALDLALRHRRRSGGIRTNARRSQCTRDAERRLLTAERVDDTLSTEVVATGPTDGGRWLELVSRASLFHALQPFALARELSGPRIRRPSNPPRGASAVCPSCFTVPRRSGDKWAERTSAGCERDLMGNP